jgi:hypothetical protein
MNKSAVREWADALVSRPAASRIRYCFGARPNGIYGKSLLETLQVKCITQPEF